MSGDRWGIDLDDAQDITEAIRLEAYLMKEIDHRNGTAGYRGAVNIYHGFKMIGRFECSRRWRKIKKASTHLRRLVMIVKRTEWAGIIDIKED